MTVTFTIDAEYTGFRTVERAAEEGQEPTTEQVPTKAIQATFTDGTLTHQREVNVCFDSEGAYDHEATLVRLEEVARGVEAKIAAGVIS
jgi:hypothetical protein